MLRWPVEGAPFTAIPIETAEAGQDAAALPDLLDLAGACIAFRRNAEIFAEGEPADDLYKVLTGAARACKLMPDGRRHVSAFYLPGDVFGLEAGASHGTSAEAVGECRIRIAVKRRFLAPAARDGELMAQLWDHTLRQLQRAQDHLLLLARKSAQERMAAFLLDMAERLPNEGAIELPMPRQDIADYLGLTIETVSRTLSQMEHERIIAMPISRRIVIRDRRALLEMNGSHRKAKRAAGAGEAPR